MMRKTSIAAQPLITTDWLKYQLGKIAQKPLDPYSPGLELAANFFYQFFEERIEDAPGTE